MKLSKIEKELFVNSKHSADFDNADLMIFCADFGEALTIACSPRYEPVSNTLQIKVDLKPYLAEYFKKHYPQIKE
jgi:hypothetical protein